MIVVQQTLLSQTLRFVVRSGVPTSLTLIDENTNVPQVVSNLTFFMLSYTNACNCTLPFVKENHFYWAILKDFNNNVLLKERVFCTNQNIDTFSVNNGGYVSNQTTNDFIMYE